MADKEQVNIFNSPVLLITAYVFAAYCWLKALIFGKRAAHNVLISTTDDVDVKSESQSLNIEELFRLKITERMYEEALCIAEKNSLATDDVYKAQFLVEPLTSLLVDSCLARIQDHKWVVEEIFTKLSDDADVYFSLFNLGLKITNGDPNLVEDRVKIMNFIDRLEDYQDMTRNREEFNKSYYMEVRHLTCLEFTIHLAEQQKLEELKFLLRKRSNELVEFWLIILDHIPETTPVENYDYLLPFKQNLSLLWGDNMARELVALFENEHQDWKGDQDFRIKDKACICRPFVIDWFKHRTLAIESLTGLPDLAENFIELVIRNTELHELSPLKDDMKFFRLFTFAQYHDKYTNFVNFVASPPLKIAEEFLAQIDPNVLGSAFFDFVLPFFQHYARHHSSASSISSLLMTLFTTLSKISLKGLNSFIAYISKNGGLQKLNGFFNTSSTQTGDFLLELVENCFEICADDNFDQMMDDGYDIADKIDELCSTLTSQKVVTDRIRKNLQALRLLNSLNVRCDYCKMKRMSLNYKEAVQLFKRLANQFVNDATLVSKKTIAVTRNRTQTILPLQASSTSKRISLLDTEYWKLSIRKLNEIRILAFESVINENDCVKFLVEFMLNSSDYSLIQAASYFLTLELVIDPGNAAQYKLTFEESLALILNCGLSYINESINAGDKALLYARQCFKLMEKNNIDSVKKELDFLEALSLLNSYGINDLPLKLHLLEDKSQLIDRIFENDENAYKDLSNLTSICRLLRITGDKAENAEIYSLRRCADQALERQDQTTCCGYCQTLVKLNDSLSWTICQRLAKSLSPQPNSAFTLELLRFCLLNCDPTSLMDVLIDYLKAMNDSEMSKDATNPGFNDLFYIEEFSERTANESGQRNINMSIKRRPENDSDDEFERLMLKASYFLKNGEPKNAGDVLLKAYHVPQAMATHKTVSYLIKKLQEKL